MSEKSAKDMNLIEYIKFHGIPERMEIHERLVPVLEEPRRLWELGRTQSLEMAVAQLSRKGYLMRHIAIAARVTEQTAHKLRKNGEVLLKQLEEQTIRNYRIEVRDRIVYEEGATC